MKCEKCGKNIANVHYRKNINGAVTEQHLCSECAGEIDDEIGFFGRDFLGDMFDDMFGRSLFSGFGLMPALIPAFMLPGYGVSFGEKAEESPAEDTNSDKKLSDEKIIPEISKKREIKMLRAQLKTAIDEERYEDAAVIRDKIRELEK